MRLRCPRCLQAMFACYCARVRPFQTGIEWIILMHPLEARRRMASGRMAHLFLRESKLLIGTDYTKDPRFEALTRDQGMASLALFPGPLAINLSPLSPSQRAASLPLGRPLRVFVIDGTWNTAKKTLRRHPYLSQLPQIMFSPPFESRFRVRKQPFPGCLSTLEAIHHLIDLLGPVVGYNTGLREHDSMLETFDHLVDQQVAVMERLTESGDVLHPRRRRLKGSTAKT